MVKDCGNIVVKFDLSQSGATTKRIVINICYMGWDSVGLEAGTICK